MQLNPAEISELIKSRIEGLSASVDIRIAALVMRATVSWMSMRSSSGPESFAR